MKNFTLAVLAGAAALALLSGCAIDDYYDGYDSYGGAYAGNYPYRGYGYDPYYGYGYRYGGYGYPYYDYYSTPFTTFGLGLGLGYYDFGGGFRDRRDFDRDFDRRGDRRGFAGGGGGPVGGGAQGGGAQSGGGQGGARSGGRDFGGQNIAPALRGPSRAQGGGRTRGMQE